MRGVSQLASREACVEFWTVKACILRWTFFLNTALPRTFQEGCFRQSPVTFSPRLRGLGQHVVHSSLQIPPLPRPSVPLFQVQQRTESHAETASNPKEIEAFSTLCINLKRTIHVCIPSAHIERATPSTKVKTYLYEWTRPQTNCFY